MFKTNLLKALRWFEHQVRRGQGVGHLYNDQVWMGPDGTKTMETLDVSIEWIADKVSVLTRIALGLPFVLGYFAIGLFRPQKNMTLEEYRNR